AAPVFEPVNGYLLFLRVAPLPRGPAVSSSSLQSCEANGLCPAEVNRSAAGGDSREVFAVPSLVPGPGRGGNGIDSGRDRPCVGAAARWAHSRKSLHRFPFLD